MTGALLAVGVMVAGCGDQAASSPAPARTPTAAATGTPATGRPPIPIAPQALSAGSGGLTVRYIDGDGSTKTLRVEDFRR
jgi:hypothetical protein